MVSDMNGQLMRPVKPKITVPVLTNSQQGQEEVIPSCYLGLQVRGNKT